MLVHSENQQNGFRQLHALNYHRLAVNYSRFYSPLHFITSSLDRTVVINHLDTTSESSALQTLRTINLARAHAVDIQLISSTTILISTSDRQILVYDIGSGDMLHNYKTTMDSSELVTLGNVGLSSILMLPPLMKARGLGSPIPQGQARFRPLLAGAGNDKVPPFYLSNVADHSLFVYMTMTQEL